MPIYAYKCTACGYARDVLQKMSDPLLTVCPQCNADQFVKQVTAAGFQLKGSGWYATDFKGGTGPASTKDEGGAPTGAASSDASSDAPTAPAANVDKAAPAATAPAVASAPVASSASSSPKAD